MAGLRQYIEPVQISSLIEVVMLNIKHGLREGIAQDSLEIQDWAKLATHLATALMPEELAATKKILAATLGFSFTPECKHALILFQVTQRLIKQKGEKENDTRLRFNERSRKRRDHPSR